jgi:hypothetical protein
MRSKQQNDIEVNPSRAGKKEFLSSACASDASGS